VDAVTKDLNKYMQKIDFENKKYEEFMDEIADKIEMIGNFARQIKPILWKYKDIYDLDFTEDLLREISDKVLESI